MENLINDVRQALRQFRQAPGFTCAAVAAFALGIGANTAIFSVVNAVLLKPIPFPEPDRLVMLMNSGPRGSSPAASPAKFAHYLQQSAALEEVSAFREGVLSITGGETPEQLRSGQVSANYFRLFRAPIVLGRPFSAEEDRPRAPKTALISHGLWERHFGRDPVVLGRTITLNGEPATIIGVVGPQFNVAEFGPPPEVWIPFQLDTESTDQGHYFRVAARLKPGVSLGQAKALLEVSAAAFRKKFPNALGPNSGFTVTPFQEAFVARVRPTLWVMTGAVACVLLIACANVANLLLVRASRRKQEIAVRAAIGAARGRIISQLLTESVLLSLGGGALGLVLGVSGMRALLAINTADLPRLGEAGSLLGLDWRVAAFTLGLALVTGMLFGLLPALHASRTDLSVTLKEGGGRLGTGFRQNKLRSTLVVAEIALALVLLVGSALMIRTFLALRSVNPGFDPVNVLTMRMNLAGPRYAQSASLDRMAREGIERIRALPGVEAASATYCVPLEGGYGLPFQILGRPLQDGPFHGGGGWTTVSPGYFDVFRIPVKRGRAITERDDAAGPPVVVINEAMARLYWKDTDALNDRLLIGKGVMKEFASEQPRQIIGIVADSRDGGLNDDPQPTMFIPQGQVPDAANALNVGLTPMAWVIRTKTNPYALEAPVREQLRQLTGLPVSDVRTMQEIVTISTSRQRFNMVLMGVFGASALVLAVIGVYGLISYTVQQRTREIGIRIALGADAGSVRRMVVVQGMWLAAAGIVLGLGAASGLVRYLAQFLFGVGAWDRGVFVGTPLLLALVALAAVWFPACRASRVDPVVALRTE
jgi:putative ABC transport system permease protein